ncbi:ATP-dependent zinc metalloprotease FtsH [Colletotrichum sp. SAR11_240]|nr:ATP-dependent zinc metalloprotease FtsH [Colletotrichum sp. SAR11_240]
MSQVAVSTSNKDDGAKPDSKVRSRILRYDEVYDLYANSYLAPYCKARKAVLRVRRLMDENGVHTKTEVDIKSKRISQVMQEINPDVESISLKKNPPVPKDEELISDLAETVKFADEDHATNIANLEPLLGAGEITWDLLWALFPPNILVYRYHRFTEQDQVLKFRTISQQKWPDKSRYWRLSCHIVADDGIKFGLATEPMVTIIDEFTGARKIADLRKFPLRYHEKWSEILASALSRGRRLVEFREPRVMETSGSAMFENRAFAMPRLIDVKWNHQAFDDLVLEKSTKTLVHSMVKQHSSKGDSFDDIISGKGKGIVCLFSGPPGSGKTLTAEAVAEITRKPLYSVSAGDLGVKPKEVDQKLSEILELSHKWNSVLLLDEADVFLQKRDSADIQRNALVSIFLRQLEYYQGILILTTNRVAECDAAFESRIHIPILYPDLDEAARRKIWAMFLRKIKNTPQGAAIGITEEDISRLAKMEINGRKF